MLLYFATRPEGEELRLLPLLLLVVLLIMLMVLLIIMVSLSIFNSFLEFSLENQFSMSILALLLPE